MRLGIKIVYTLIVYYRKYPVKTVAGNEKGVLVADGLVAIIGKETFKSILAGIQPVDPLIGGDPMNVLLFLQDVADDIVADTLGIPRVGLEHFEVPPVIYIQTIPGTKPEQSAGILVNGVDGTVGEPIIVCQI